MQKTILTINQREIEKKIRKTAAPASRLHKNKKAYSRKTKHPKQKTELF
ncbi:MAG: hypothetical protein WCT54_04615 [Patescibacteria group bacterium]|jgi:hypothetical protein